MANIKVKKIKENIENYRRYPNDFVHALLSYHVYKDCRPSQEIELENYTQHLNEWKIHQVFTISKSGYYAAIYENSTTHNIVLAHRGTAPSLKQLFETDGPINTDIKGILNGEFVQQQIDAYEATKEAVEYAREKCFELSITGHSIVLVLENI